MELKQAFFILRHGSAEESPRYLEAIKTIEENCTLLAYGEWIPISDGDMAECSECGECYDSGNGGMIAFSLFKQFYKYCPNCGARMDGDKDDKG